MSPASDLGYILQLRDCLFSITLLYSPVRARSGLASGDLMAHGSASGCLRLLRIFGFHGGLQQTPRKTYDDSFQSDSEVWMAWHVRKSLPTGSQFWFRASQPKTIPVWTTYTDIRHIFCALGFPIDRCRGYECARCHRIQEIPHPMWRYQKGPNDYGTASWACHQGCDAFTHWRIIPEDVSQAGWVVQFTRDWETSMGYLQPKTSTRSCGSTKMECQSSRPLPQLPGLIFGFQISARHQSLRPRFFSSFPSQVPATECPESWGRFCSKPSLAGKNQRVALREFLSMIRLGGV